MLDRATTIASKRSNNGYDAAKASRLRDGWQLGNQSAFQISMNVGRLRAASRDLCRNNDYANKFRRSWAANTVGIGIKPDFANADIDGHWADWACNCDAESNLAFYGLESLVAKTVVESGECLVVRNLQRRSARRRSGLTIRVLEPEYIDDTKNESARDGSGRVTVNGIEYGPRGAKLAFWLYREHPLDFDRTIYRNRESRRVPADSVCHIFEVDRPGQQRGVPRFAPVVLRLYDVKDYDEAEITRKRVESCLTAWVHGDVDYSIGQEAQGKDIAGLMRREATIEPGMINYMPTGSMVSFTEPKAAGDYLEFMSTQLHAAAAGMGISYEALTGDLAKVNYSSLRYGNNEFRRYVREFQHHHLIPQLCERVRRWFIDDLVNGEVIPEGNHRAEWRTPKLESIDPLKDAMADLMDVRMGKKPMQRLIGEDGHSWMDVVAEFAAWNEATKDLVFDSNPAKVAKSGAAQPNPMETADED